MSDNGPLLSVRVQRKQQEALDICSLELVPVNDQQLPAFTAGSHLDLHLPGGVVRQYSLCNTPDQATHYQVAVLRDAQSRGGSKAVHDLLHEGDVLNISHPKNHFALAPSASRHLLLAGGIGVTPMMAMAETLAAQGAVFEMHYCTRSAERTAFAPRLAAAPYSAHVHLHHDDGDASQKIDIEALLRNQASHADTHLYVCGPQGFMDAVLNTARAQAWPEARLHYEFFSTAPTARDTDGPFEIEIASSGQVITVPADSTALQALLKAGVDVLMSCEQGVCGTCLTRVKSGEPDHRDQYLTPDEHAANDQFTPCCSRSKSERLVLDL
ncbi:2Fe-2S iron-sulfur cluster-binding protein [Hydrogenophaga sp.]|uniref:PDR/VanB family oxidoreductase n=1 Tax=Hydrogenophaga sp. TaxID=1904254 RepID=UPI003565E807